MLHKGCLRPLGPLELILGQHVLKECGNAVMPRSGKITGRVIFVHSYLHLFIRFDVLPWIWVIFPVPTVKKQ